MATKLIPAVMLASLGLGCAPEAPMAMPQAYEIDWTILVEVGQCAEWRWDDPDTLYLPAEDNGSDCTDPAEPANGVFESVVQCDFRPEEDLFITSAFRIELHTGGDATSELTVEEPESSFFRCYLKYEGTVTEL